MGAHRHRIIDLGLALGVVVVGLAELWVPFTSRQASGSLAFTTVVVVTAGVALTQRRRHPLVVGVVVLWTWCAIFTFVEIYVLFWGQFVPMGVAVFSMARHGRGREPYVGAGVAALSLLYFDFFVEVLQSPGEIIFHWSVFTMLWLFGYGLAASERRARESTRRAIDAEVAAAEQALVAVVEERTRIARELHDIVAHSVTSMVVQAGAAEQIVDDDPAQVRAALTAIRETGTGALAEMRRVVAVLRDAEEPGALAPQPGVADIGQLLDGVRAAGLEAELEVVGEARELPAGVDLAAYRIVQESLTNVRRHARARSVRVVLDYRDDDLRISVVDDGVGVDGAARAETATGGHGLMGMRERASLYGGDVRTESADGSGFAVRAVLPVPAS